MRLASPYKVAQAYKNRRAFVTYEVWDEEDLRQPGRTTGVPGASEDVPDSPQTRDLRKIDQAPERPVSSYSVGQDFGVVDQDTPSARVRPFNNDFDIDYPWQFKRAYALVDEIMKGVPDSIVERSESYQPELLKRNRLTGRMRFKVGDWLVSVRIKNPDSAEKMELRLKCNCPFWRYQGPDFWAKKEKYLDGRAAGKATFPWIRDPGGQNGLCKHATAVVVHLVANARSTKGG